MKSVWAKWINKFYILRSIQRETIEVGQRLIRAVCKIFQHRDGKHLRLLIHEYVLNMYLLQVSVGVQKTNLTHYGYNTLERYMLNNCIDVI